jgi:Flp pilus assembly protein TadG
MKYMTKRQRRAGTSLVEAALTLGLYTSIVFSIFDFGYVMYMHQTVAYRVQSAARYGSLNPTDTTGMTNYVLYNSSTGSGPGIFGITTSSVTATRTGSATTADRITVTVTGFRYPMISPGF